MEIFLGPMAGITDAAMRSISRIFGAPLCYTEMVSAKGLLYENRNTKRLLTRFPNEDRFIVQIFGREPETMAEAAKLLETGLGKALAGIDLNMGCPAPKIFKQGEGAALMREPQLAGRIIEACVKATVVPVSVKIRSGVDASHINAAEFVHLAQEAGAVRVAVHGRTAAMGYHGSVDLNVIAACKKAARIPVIGNGDIDGVPAAIRMLEATGCDGLMVARGAIGNPFLFAELEAYFEGRSVPKPPTPRERIAVLKEQARLACADKGEYVGIREMRAQIPRYLKGLRGAAAVRGTMNEASTLTALEGLLDQYVERLEAHAAQMETSS